MAPVSMPEVRLVGSGTPLIMICSIIGWTEEFQ